MVLRFRSWLIALAVSLALSDVVRGQEDLTPEELRRKPLSELDPPYAAFRDRDYNRLKEGDPERSEVLEDLPDGGITVLSIAECAVECTMTPDCNAASWYGASPQWTDVRNCWLKKLEPACQLPSDAEKHDDNRAFLIALPRECNGQPSISSPPDRSVAVSPEGAPDERPSEASQQQMQDDTDETINTPAEVQAVLGDRQMNSDVPNVTEIESVAITTCPGRLSAISLLGIGVAYIVL
eukprot:jgi/Ulvmu1/6163/UM028_0019.1